MSMKPAKQEIQELLSELPEDVSFDDIQYHIYVRQKIERGLNDVESGHILTEKDFDRRMARWLEL